MKSIRRWLIASLLAGFILLLGASEAAVYFITRNSLRAESDAALLARARAMAALVRQDEDGIEYDFPEELLVEFSAGQNEQHFEIRNADGKLLRGSHKENSEEKVRRPALSKTASFWDATLGEHHARSVGFLFSPQQEDNEGDEKKTRLLPVLSLILTRDQSSLDHTLERLLAVLSGACLAVLGGTVLLVAFVVRSGLRPLDEIGKQAARIDASSLGSRFSLDAVPIELRSVCERLNDLLSRLHESFRREQRFSADVAHELRTPVAELRALSEVALKWPPRETETPKVFQDAFEIARKMDSIVSGLLALVRCEEGQQSFRLEPVRMRPLIEKTWDPFASKASHKRLKVLVSVPDTLVAGSDAAALEIILTNLFSNAVEYALVDGDIEITAQLSNRKVVINCANTTSDLDPKNLPHLCERFWRKDSARQDSAHSGLGLAISQQFAERLGAEFRMELLSKAKFQITLTLPADAADAHENADRQSLQRV